jgi:hypothetical protein
MKSKDAAVSYEEDRRVLVLNYIQETDLALRGRSTPEGERLITIAYQSLARACRLSEGQGARLLMQARVACGQARATMRE